VSGQLERGDLRLMLLCRFEMLGEPQRDLTAEQAAARIRDCDTTHYLAKSNA